MAAGGGRIELAGVGRTYASARGPVEALAGISLAIGAGEFVSLVGPSGCGKSTLLRCLAGLDRPSAGTIRIDGAALDGPPPGLGMVFQRDVLLDWRTVLDNVLITAEFQDRPRAAHREEALRLLARFGLAGFEHRHPWELSGGMRQRVAICRALLCDPAILLMDEPFGALDAMTRDDLNLELARLWQDSRKTVVFVTHSIAEAIFLSDRVVMMSRGPGRVVEVVDVDLQRPRDLALRETPGFARLARHVRALFARLGIVKE